MENLTLVDHPLLRRDLSILRDKATPHGVFRRTLSNAATILAYEALRGLKTRTRELVTPMEPTTGFDLDDDVVVVPIMRAGLGMVDGFVRFVPEARIGHLGMYRDERTHRPVDYYRNLPPDMAEARIFLVDPMLATGGSACGAISLLKARGGEQFTFICLVAAPEGIQRLAETHPDVPVIAASLDRQLDANAYILPGLGDAGDRIFGTDQ